MFAAENRVLSIRAKGAVYLSLETPPLKKKKKERAWFTQAQAEGRACAAKKKPLGRRKLSAEELMRLNCGAGEDS